MNVVHCQTASATVWVSRRTRPMMASKVQRLFSTVRALHHDNPLVYHAISLFYVL